MSVQTVTVGGDWLKKVSYDTETGDLTIYYMDGSSNRYIDVPKAVIKDLQELTDAKYPFKEVEHYLVQTMTKTKRGMYAGKGRYVPSTEDKYIRVKYSDEYTERAKEELVEYTLKKDNILIVEKKYSSNVAQVTYNDKALLITFRSGKFAYPFDDSPSVVKALFDEFVSNLSKIKNGGEAERAKYSLGKLANFVNTKHSKPKK